MIKVTRLDGSELIVNSDLLEFIEQTPDTVLSLIGGKKLVVREHANEIVERVVEYQRAIGIKLGRRSPAPMLSIVAATASHAAQEG